MAERKNIFKREQSNVAVVGLGYVGLPLATLTATKGYRVIGIDTDETKTEAIKNGNSPIADELVLKHLRPGTIQATTSFEQISECETVLVCVPTPVYKDYLPNLKPLKNACRSLAKHLSPGTLIIIESTINPGVCEEEILPVIEKESGLKAGSGFYLSHCPERINPGDPKWNVENIPRVIGSYDLVGLERSLDFYQSIIQAEVKPMASLKEAEAVKVVENTYRDINIAFVNELAMSFTKLGINVKNVIDGAATKPFAFMAHYPGIGVGGHCIPVDPYYLIEYAKKSGFNHNFLQLARHINNSMPEHTLNQLVDGLNEAGLALSRARIAILGISYKPNVGDDRESPTYKLLHLLEDKRAMVECYDQFFPEVSTAKSLQEALIRCDAVILATAHDEFLSLTPEDLRFHEVRVLVDGRNSFSRAIFEDAGIIYRGIGI